MPAAPLAPALHPEPPADALPPAFRPGKPRFQRLRVILALMLRGMGTKHSRASGGYLWSVAEPLGSILLLSLLFSLAVRSPPIGQSFLLFYATGVLPFRSFGSMQNAVASAISGNRGLLAYPVVEPIDALLARFALNFMTDFLVAVLLFTGIIWWNDLYVTLDLAAIAAAFVLAALLGLGIGSVNCVLFGLYPTAKNVWSVLTRPLFILSGVFFVYESVPPDFQHVMWWNPLMQVIGLMRSGFYGTYHADYVSVPYILAIAGSTFLLGGYLVRRHASALIEE